MKPHKTKDDSIGNLTRAVNSLRQERQRRNARESLVRQFEQLSFSDRQRYSNKYKGYKGSLPFLNDYGKIYIMENWVNNTNK